MRRAGRWCDLSQSGTVCCTCRHRYNKVTSATRFFYNDAPPKGFCSVCDECVATDWFYKSLKNREVSMSDIPAELLVERDAVLMGETSQGEKQ